MSSIPPEAKQLARAVLDPNADLTAVCAMVDCLSESLSRPTFRYSAVYVDKLELLVREWVTMLLKGTTKGGLPEEVLSFMLTKFYNLQRDCKQQFGRDVG